MLCICKNGSFSFPDWVIDFMPVQTETVLRSSCYRLALTLSSYLFFFFLAKGGHFFHKQILILGIQALSRLWNRSMRCTGWGQTEFLWWDIQSAFHQLTETVHHHPFHPAVSSTLELRSFPAQPSTCGPSPALPVLCSLGKFVVKVRRFLVKVRSCRTCLLCLRYLIQWFLVLSVFL